MKNIALHTALITLVLLAPFSLQAEETQNTAKATPVTKTVATKTIATTQAQRADTREEMHANMEKMQEESFQRYIQSLKNYPAANQLPADVQERRASMIKNMEERHALMLKVRKQRRQEFEERQQQRMVDQKKI